MIKQDLQGGNYSAKSGFRGPRVPKASRERVSLRNGEIASVTTLSKGGVHAVERTSCIWSNRFDGGVTDFDRLRWRRREQAGSTLDYQFHGLANHAHRGRSERSA